MPEMQGLLNELYGTVSSGRTVFPPAVRTASTNSVDQSTPTAAKGSYLYLDISAASGVAPTLDVKIQARDPVSGNYVDIPGAAFAQKSAVGTDTLHICPGIAETANREVSAGMPRSWRAVATIGGTTPSFTFSLGATYIL